jgi:hypothetical protein
MVDPAAMRPSRPSRTPTLPTSSDPAQGLRQRTRGPEPPGESQPPAGPAVPTTASVRAEAHAKPPSTQPPQPSQRRHYPATRQLQTTPAGRPRGATSSHPLQPATTAQPPCATSVSDRTPLACTAEPTIRGSSPIRLPLLVSANCLRCPRRGIATHTGAGRPCGGRCAAAGRSVPATPQRGVERVEQVPVEWLRPSVPISGRMCFSARLR